MAVSLSTDLVADVMRNADPAKLRTATAQLETLKSVETGQNGFAEVMGGMDTAPPFRTAAVTQQQSLSQAPNPFVDFERMVLRNMFETLLPKAESGAFGSGPSAGVWRSLAADQLAGLYADAGGVGIASSLAKQDGRNGEAQWPYFNTGQIKAFTG